MDRRTATDNDPEKPGVSTRSSSLLKPSGLILAGLLILGVVAYGAQVLMAEVSLNGWDFSVAGMERFIESWGRWAAVASIFLMILHSFVPIPAELLAVVNGMLFGPIWGMVVTWAGAMLGAYLAFGLARALGRPFVLKMLPAKYRNVLDEWADKQGSGTLLIVRFVPIISFNAVNYAAGLTNISWWTFGWTTGLGILPLTILMNVIGDQALSWSWTFWIAVSAMVVVVSLLVWWRLLRRRGRQNRL